MSLDSSIEVFDSSLKKDNHLHQTLSGDSTPDLVSKQSTRIIDHHLKFNQSFKAMENMANIVNSTPQAAITVPNTTYKLKKKVDPNFDVVYNIKCPKCDDFTESNSNETQCVSCPQKLKTSICSYFISLPIEPQLKKIIDDNFEEIVSYHSNMKLATDNNTVRDIHDGEQYQKVSKLYPKSIVLSLVVNTDGARVFNSSNKKSLWPIQIYQNYLRPSKRYIAGNVLVAALFFGEKPNMSQIFLPLLKELKNIEQSGGICFERKQKQFLFIPLITHCVCDLPAKAAVQELNSYIGYKSCGYCHHPGVLCKKNPNDRGTVRYVRRETPDSLRTHDEFIKTYHSINSNIIDGIKSISCLVAAKHFDLVLGFGIDYMHNVLLGVSKRFFHLWFTESNHKFAYYITKKMQEVLNRRIAAIKPILEISRKPGSIFEWRNYKANEIRTLLLYYLNPCLEGLLENRFIKHFQLLSSAIYTLLQESVSLEEICIADKKLNEFVDRFEELYGRDNVTMNLHLCRHMGSAVKNLGPLWAQSAFGFEANNGVLVKSVTAKRDILQQMAWKYNTKLSFKCTEKSNHIIESGGKRNAYLNDYEKKAMELFGIKENIPFIFTFVSLRRTKFTSKRSKPISTIDYFATFADELLGAIEFYFTWQSKIYALFELFKVVSNIDHLLEIESTKECKICEVNKINKKLLYMKIKNKEFVVIQANRYEKT